MPDTDRKPNRGSSGGTPAQQGPAAPAAHGPIELRNVWQMPALLASLILMAAALATFVFSAPEPDYAGMIEHAARLVEKEQYADALNHLDHRVQPFARPRGGMPAEHRFTYHLLRARSLYMLNVINAASGRQATLERIVAEYDQAERSGGDAERRHLEPPDVYRLAMSYIALDKLDKALERAQSLPREARVQRSEILKEIVEVKLQAPAPDPASTLSLITLFLDENPNASDKAWALARRAELRIRHGYARDAVDKTLPFMAGVMSAEPERVGELHLLMATAHHELNEPREAAHQLDRAIALLPEGDPRRARALLLLARIEAGRGTPSDLEAARQRYTFILEQYTEPEARWPATLGLAEVAAALGDVETAAAEYARLVDECAAGHPPAGVPAEALAASLLGQYQTRAAAEDATGALRFARLAVRLYQPAATPPAEVLLVAARAHRRAADQRLSAGTGAPRLLELANLDPATREEARADLVAAGDFFRRHAAAIVELDNDAFGNSLWLAADSFDSAGDQSEAILLFREFADGFRSDPRRDEARFRLAQAYQARGDYELAAAAYRELIDAAHQGAHSPFADASHVPLARVLLANTDPSDDEEARTLLDAVVSGRVGGSETPDYRDALVLLARLDAADGRHGSAIARLEEALARFPEGDHVTRLQFDLAGVHRADAAEIARVLQDEMPDTERRALESTREDRLRRARVLFETVRDRMAATDPRWMSDADALRLRNSHYYAADCAFDLRDFDAAIRLYDAARERYPRDPASLVAMIQIVNAYVEQGDLQRAATANDRARRFYESLPEEVWADPNLPIGRKEWQRWLDSLAVLGGATAGAPDDEGPPRR